MESTKRISALIFRSMTGELTATEQQELEVWLSASPENRDFYEQMRQPGALRAGLGEAYQNLASQERVLARLNEAASPQPVKVLQWKRWLPYAAAAVLAGAVALLWLQKPPASEAPAAQTIAVDNAIQPGTTGAVLTLADGSTLELDSLGNGTIASQGATQLVLRNGRLSYNNSNAKDTAVTYNTISTPRGRQFQLVLEDGTRVWLNAASSLTYPTTFSATARTVSITGEAYFEVTHNADAPFKVKMGPQQEVTVLGTSFNVNAYTDEPEVSTTLVEGSVKVSNGIAGQVLRPGYQAAMRDNGITVRQADVNDIIAWKNGLFIFRKTDIHAVMRQLSRWYNIEVVFAGNPAARTLTGEVYRNYTLQQALAVLQEADLRFRISGRQLTVLP
jgi:ferric-dicitrate binding protein FerR (iron transport regulator)